MKLTSKLRRWFGDDGLLHIMTSALLMISVGLIMARVVPVGWAMLTGTLVTLSLGVYKELCDKRSNGALEIDYKDIVCDMLGLTIALWLLAATVWR